SVDHYSVLAKTIVVSPVPLKPFVEKVSFTPRGLYRGVGLRQLSLLIVAHTSSKKSQAKNQERSIQGHTQAKKKST
ncbi:hypothetical protein, partial [Pseudomonas savastanoi]